MTAENFKALIDSELSRIINKRSGTNISLHVVYDNGKDDTIRLTNQNGWYIAPTIMNGIVTLSGAENTVNATTIPSQNGYVTRTQWNRTVKYIDPEHIVDCDYTFDVIVDSTVTEPTETDGE